MCIKKQNIESFKKNGVTVLREVFSHKWIEELRCGLEYNMANPGQYFRQYTKSGDPGQFFGDYCNWRRIPQYKRFVRQSPAASIAKAIIGSEKINFFHEHVLVKEPGTLDKTPWHHDQPYYCVNGEDNVSLWVHLDPVPKEWGMEFIAGSHKWKRWFIPTKFSGGEHETVEEQFETIPDFDLEREKHTVLAFNLELGDCLAFHFRTIHGAPGTGTANCRRRAISWRWTGDDATFALRKGIMSPPFPSFDECDLEPGDALDSELFPLIGT